MLAIATSFQAFKTPQVQSTAARCWFSSSSYLRRSDLTVDGERLWNNIHHTAQWSAPSPGGLTRFCADDNDKKVRDWFRDEALSIGAKYEVNSVGAQFATLPGKDNSIPPIAMCSHLDSVLTGGKFDGSNQRSYVLGALEVLRSFKEQGNQTHAPVTVINWTNEGGARFVPSLGASSVWAEDHTVDEIHASVTHAGDSLTMGDELRRIGYIGDAPSTCSQYPLSVHFELHNGQNTELEEAGKFAGWAVGYQAVAGYEILLDGEDGHAATYAMPKRRDALVGASKIIAAAHKAARGLGALRQQPLSRPVRSASATSNQPPELLS
ncbi:Zn-dependent exopeptidase [Sarocladium strictum]